MFIAALFTIAKIQKKTKCSLTDEWKKMWYTYIHIQWNTTQPYYEIMPSAATWMDLEIIILSEERKRKTNTIWYHLYVESKI